MFANRVVSSVLLSTSLLIAGGAHAAPEAATQCVFDKYAATSVAPFRSEENLGYGTYTRLRGAQLYVPAREGLTAEWLALSVQRALAQHKDAPSEAACQPAVDDIKVSVISSGGGFWVQLGSDDEKAAAVLLRWARSVVPTSYQQKVSASAR